MKTVKEVFTFVCLFTAVLGNGELTIHHSPNGINFKGSEPIDSSELPNILTTAIGSSSNMDDSWEGLTILTPFNYPKIAVIVEIEGLATVKVGDNTYPLRTTINHQLTKDIFTLKLGGNVITQNDIISADVTDDFKMEKLNPTDEAVIEFVKDLKLLKNLRQQVEKKIDVDAVWIQLKGLNRIVQLYGQSSGQSSEAVEILKNALDQLESNLENVYGEKFLLASITDDNHHTRHVRAADNNNSKPAADPKIKPNINLSKRYDQNYSAIFNIILWTSIFLIAALISTAVFICTLDPGRDSIIYRMTTQRIKKEN